MVLVGSAQGLAFGGSECILGCIPGIYGCRYAASSILLELYFAVELQRWMLPGPRQPFCSNIASASCSRASLS